MIFIACGFAIIAAFAIASIHDPDERPKMQNMPLPRYRVRFVDIVAALLGAAAILTCLLFMVVTGAFAHSWYPIECCSDRDCAPVADDAIEETASGFLIKATGEVVSFQKARVVPDGRYHVCRYPSGGLICFFRPLRGV